MEDRPKQQSQKAGDGAQALKDLQEFLKPSIENAKNGIFSKRDLRQIMEKFKHR